MSGNGFVFVDYSAGALTDSLKIALSAYQKKDAWDRVVKRIMLQDFSWKGPAEKYEELYNRARDLK